MKDIICNNSLNYESFRFTIREGLQLPLKHSLTGSFISMIRSTLQAPGLTIFYL